MQTNTQHLKILRRFLQQCRPATTKALGFLDVDADVFECRREAAAAVAALRDSFSDDELQASGLVKFGDDKSIALHAALAGGRRFIVLRDAESGQPFELLTGEGCLARDSLPALEMLRDARTRELLRERNGELLVAFALDDVILLRACGFAATLASGLDKLSPEWLDDFCRAFNIDRESDANETMHDTRGGGEAARPEPTERNDSRAADVANDPNEQRAPQSHAQEVGGASSPSTGTPAPSASTPARETGAKLRLVAWQPTQLSATPPAGFDAVVKHFVGLRDFLGLEIDDLEVISASANAVLGMRFVAGFRHANQFRKALVDALDGYGFLMSYMPDESESPSAPIDYPTALARYYELLAAGPPRDTFAQEELQRARAEVDRRLQEQLIEPIRSAALEEHDLLQRALLMSLAEVNNIFHAQSLSLSEMARRDNSRSTPQSTKELTKTLLALSDRIANMTRAARQFSESRGAIVPLRRAKSPTSQPLRRWG